MTQKTFIEIYKVEEEVCDKIIALYNKNRKFVQAGRLGSDRRIDKDMKDSMDLSVPIQSYGYFEPFFEQLTNHVNEYLKKYFHDTGAPDMRPVVFSKFSNI